MKWLNSTAVGMVLGLVLNSQKQFIKENITRNSHYSYAVSEDLSFLKGSVPFNTNLVAGSIWLVNTFALVNDLLSINSNNAEISLVNDKGKQVKILLCKKKDIVDSISKSIQVFTPITYCVWKQFLEKSFMEFLNYEHSPSEISPKQVIDFAIYGGIVATVFNIVGPKFFHEQLAFDVPEDLNLYLEHTTEDGYIQIQNVIGHAEVTVN